MLRTFLINPILVLIAVVVGVVILRAFSRTPATMEIVEAAGVSLIAAELALVPMMLQRNARPADIAQASMIGITVHLFLSLVLGAAVLFSFRPGMVFVYWLLGLYWVTLIGVAGVLIRTIRYASRTFSTAP